MKTTVKSASCDAMTTTLVTIESGYTRGFSGLQLIGNTSDVCRDGKERAKTALEALGVHLPNQRLVVSLAPADIRKDGNHFDLPIAVTLALLVLPGVPRVDPGNWLFAAELGLDGRLRPVKSIVSYAIAAVSHGLTGIVVAEENLADVATLTRFDVPCLRELEVLGFTELKDVIDWLYEDQAARCQRPTAEVRSTRPDDTTQLDFDDMLLSAEQERLATCAAAGLHSLLLRGTPGTGKSMFAARLGSILPPMSQKEHLEALQIHSSHAERIPPALIEGRPPFRSPHHQSSAAAILGNPEGPGELSLAHGGILFLDEFPEFRRDLIEALREPLESGEVKVSRAKRKVRWSARTTLVAAANNCPCGWLGSAKRNCDCSTPKQIGYRLRLSGPILDRIDLHYNMPEAAAAGHDFILELGRAASSGQTARLRERVSAAREFGRGRNRRIGVEFNRDLQPRHLLAASGLGDAELSAILRRHVAPSASGRAIVRSVRVARTLADLDGSPAIRDVDLQAAWSWQAEAAARQRGEA